jgi:hypothetical protein
MVIVRKRNRFSIEYRSEKHMDTFWHGVRGECDYEWLVGRDEENNEARACACHVRTVELKLLVALVPRYRIFSSYGEEEKGKSKKHFVLNSADFEMQTQV